MGQAVSVAMLYGFTQLFMNEGRKILPLLWELREQAGRVELIPFVDSLLQYIYKKHKLKPAETAPKLTAQQRAMLSYLRKGMTYSEIADAIGIGRATVKSHVLQMYKRLGVRDALQAIVKAKMLGL